MLNQQNIRVLFLHRKADENGIGGMIEYLHYLPLFLKKQQVDVLLYREGDGNQLQGPTTFKNGMSTYAGPFLKPRFFSFGRKLTPLLQLCKNENIDLIHAQGTYRSGYLAMRLYQQTGLPFLVTSHSDIVPSSGRMHRKKVQRDCQKILKAAAGVTHLSPPMATLSHQIQPTQEKSILIGNGIDLENWQAYQDLPAQNYLLSLGRLEWEKGFHILIDAYATLCQRGCKTALVLAGTGSAEDALQALAKEKGLAVRTNVTDCSRLPEQCVAFTGYVRGHLKKQLIAQSKIVLFPTQPALWEEPFGMVLIEAMAAGKPIIASNSETTRYIKTQGLHVLLTEPAHPLGWADIIQQLLNDPTQQASLRKANLENASRFDWHVIAKQYRMAYLQALQRH
ncbi:MAG: hypothetical protein A3F43_00565 [Gammaproteobacteria bacterium RIFCSPHIGHO2_12_FULL_42_10]|nr:MAG: hypothetical protein A3F43_00565 [Gammaproteobacteria bacterium RIFCSPHIGHO2_12_FULL_42_10]